MGAPSSSLKLSHATSDGSEEGEEEEEGRSSLSSLPTSKDSVRAGSYVAKADATTVDVYKGAQVDALEKLLFFVACIYFSLTLASISVSFLWRSLFPSFPPAFYPP